MNHSTVKFVKIDVNDRKCGSISLRSPQLAYTLFCLINMTRMEKSSFQRNLKAKSGTFEIKIISDIIKSIL